MRKKFEVQYEFGATPVEKIQMPLRSRDEVPAVLRALQHIFSTPELNEKVFSLLDRKIKPGVNKRTGRPGMSLWEILVFGSVRLARDINYDHLEHIANFDSLVRKLVGISDFGENLKRYPLQTLKDNVSLLDEETIDEINELIIMTGHKLKKNEKLNVKIDTYVLETNVHFPTDINLLWDAGRKSIELISQIIKDSHKDVGWRKHHDWRKKLKSAYHSAAKRTVGKGRYTTRGFDAALRYLTLADNLSQKVKSTRAMVEEIASRSFSKVNKLIELDYYEKHLDKHIDLVRRRIIFAEQIPHEEKVFSLFEPHTEWIKKGKAGDKVELGLRIAVATDQYGFILGHRVMVREQDVEVTVPFTAGLAGKYDFISVSYDKSFWSPKNFREISCMVPHVIMPKKGKLNKVEYEREHNKEFKKLRNQHAAVESDINCLEHHGLNRCPDKGLTNFKKYTSFGILVYNLHKLGNILLERDRRRLSKSKILKKAA
jgi:hypothetical protein